MKKNIVLGVSGSIAAYKACSLVRLLKDNGCEVKVVMTQSACRLIQPLTFQALSGHPVCYDKRDKISFNGMDHITLSQWCDQLIIAPCSANLIAKIAHGHADDELSALVLACKKPIYIAPAMNANMWDNPATKDNLCTLISRGIHIIDPTSGRQACGSCGVGNMCSPEIIAKKTVDQTQSLKGVHALITAGPTQENIDPIRYISNHSSGQMGYAIAEAFIDQGAQVTLISGPSTLSPPRNCKCIKVISAKQMFDAICKYITEANILIAAAAVSDYRPKHQSLEKIKKNTQETNIALYPNIDILNQTIGLNPQCIRVGFALETSNLIANALVKKQSKKLDFIIANLAKDSLNSSKTTAHIIGPDNNSIQTHKNIDKTQFAYQLTQHLTNHLLLYKSCASSA